MVQRKETGGGGRSLRSQLMTLLDMAREIEGDRNLNPHGFDALDNAKEHASDMAMAEDSLNQAAEHQYIHGEQEAEMQELRLTSPSDMTGQFHSAKHALDFILAGDAYFTVRSQKTQTRFTYHVERAACSRCGSKTCTCWLYPVYFCSVLVGPDNRESYKFIGILKENHEFLRTRKSKLEDKAPSVVAFKWVLSNLLTSPNMPRDLEIWHEGRCGRCGRKLTVPESVERGLGPECASIMGGGK